MRHFRYQAMDASGERREGDLRAANADEARQILRAKGLFVTVLEETGQAIHGYDSSESPAPVSKTEASSATGRTDSSEDWREAYQLQGKKKLKLHERVGASRDRTPAANQAAGGAWFFVVVGTLAALFGFGWGVRSLCLLTGAKRTTGTVVQLREETTSRVGESGTETTWHPVVEYEVDGVKYRTEGDVGSTPTWLPRVGENVEVLYPADQPASGRLNTFLDNWAMPLVFGGVGSFFAALGIFMVRSQRRRA